VPASGGILRGCILAPGMAVDTRGAGTTGRVSAFRERFFNDLLRDSFAYVPARDHEHPYPERLKTSSRLGQWRLAARGTLVDLARRLTQRAGWSGAGEWVEQAALELAATAGRLEELEAAYEALGDEPSRELFVKLLEWRVLGPRRVRLPVTPNGYRTGLERVHRELLRERGTREVDDPYFPRLNRYAYALGGRALAVETDETSMLDTFVLRQYTYERGPAGVRAEPGDLVLDGGGGYGDTALYFASLVGAEGEVIVVEMDPRNRRAIERNLELNPELASRVRVVDAALWEASGVSLSYVAGGKTSRLGVEAASDRATTETVTLDELLERIGVDRVDFLKLDVEGAELPVLKGASRTLERLRPKLAIAAYHHGEDLTALPLYLRDLGLGYRLFLNHISAGRDETVLFASP
jgi:FkbM family methyltransferase